MKVETQKSIGLDHLKNFFLTPKNIVITTHHKPDADALGSSLAMFLYLSKLNHHVKVIVPSDYPSFLTWMPGNNCILNFEESDSVKVKCEEFVSVADLIICLDFSSVDRMNELKHCVLNSGAKKLNIDHHLSPENFADFVYWNSQSSSTCELIYTFIDLMGGKSLIDVNIGECIYAGIMTDTGSFRFPSTSAEVHIIISELIKLGVENSKIHKNVYDNSSEIRLRFTGYAICNKLFVMYDYCTAFIVITKEELKQYKSQTGDTEGLVNYALSIEGIKFAALMVERKDGVKISFRSSGDFSVNEFANAHFEGGGHKNASGGKSNLGIDDTVKKFVDLLVQYPELTIKTKIENVSIGC